MSLIQCSASLFDKADDLTSDGISHAVQEILTFILEKSLWRADKLYLNVNVKSIKQDLASVTWFYIKITTSFEIKTDDFRGSRFGHLFGLLQKLQGLESESHLCLHYPRTDGQPGSIQDNKLWVNNELRTIDQLYKTKHASCFTIHLRVHVELWKMSKECGNIHNFMLLSKVFRPKDELTFSMKLGEVLSDTDFRVKWCRRVSEDIPEVVTDSSFYFKKDSLDSCRCLNGEPSFSSTHIVKKGCLSSNGGLVQKVLTLQVIGLCFPFDDDRGKESSCVNVSMFGPNFLPFNGISYLESLIECIDWGQYGLRFCSSTAKNHFVGAKFHGHLKHKKSSLMDRVHIEILLIVLTDRQSDTSNDDALIADAIEESQSVVVKKIEDVLEQVLQPVLLKAKTRSMVQRSIRSVCKGVVNIVSMSSSDDFHSKVLDFMKVSDTIELGKVLENQLKSINTKRHAGIWAGSLQSDHLVSEHGNQSQYEEDQIVPTISNSVHNETTHRQPSIVRCEEITPTEDCEPVENDFERGKETLITDTSAVSADLIVDKTNINTMSPFNELAFGDEDEAFGTQKTPGITPLIPDDVASNLDSQHTRDMVITGDDKVMSPFSELGGLEDFHAKGTPERTLKSPRASKHDENAISNAAITLPKRKLIMSPFNELAFCENELFGAFRSPELINSRNYYKKSYGDTKVPLDTQTLSPSNKEPGRVDGDLYVDKTPEITQLTKSFKEVSPFQEFPVTDVDIIRDIGEDPFKDQIHESSEALPVPSTMVYHSHEKYPRIETQLEENHIKGPLPNSNRGSDMFEIHHGSETGGMSTRNNVHYNAISQSKYHTSSTQKNTGISLIRGNALTNSNHEISVVNKYHTLSQNNTNTSQIRGCVLSKTNIEISTERETSTSSLFDKDIVLDNEKNDDHIDDDSEDWFNDVLDGVDHWLK